MLESGVGEELRAALVNAVLLALWAVLPALLLGLIRQWSAGRRARPDFSLRRSEAVELDRALLLYETACCRLKEIANQANSANKWRALFGLRIELNQQHAEEVEELNAHAHYLREIIIQFKRAPLQRLRSWINALGLQFALGGALIAHIACFALLMVALYTSATTLTAGLESPLVWYPLDERIFYSNGGASVFAALTAPVFFLMRRAKLRREYSVELCALKAFAVASPTALLDQLKVDGHSHDESQRADLSDGGHCESWFTVLGLSHSATVDEVKGAYKRLIKQNHPDRVQGMSPAFRQLAEAETKKLNTAYHHALFSIPSLDSTKSATANYT